ncbi:endospore germination permease [Paenibacillus thalictri]|uniref:Spore gernimation protein n=1 Tax=Paenibacillus thalictri TaxID=2527873 RepID=A0A4V2J3T1_9BACL|nr:endospore germination permease [Paenibacillus thalictri]TBL75346.1 spore gernimation protein [Paenibacillus thalictri]
MPSSKKITALQMYYIITLSGGIANHVLLIPILLQIAKRDAWFGAVAGLVPLCAWSLIILWIVNRSEAGTLSEWVKKSAGRIVHLLVVAGAILLFFVSSVVSLRDIVTWTHVSYLPATPETWIAATFVLMCFFAAASGIRTIAITSGILLPCVVFLGLLVMTANFQYKDYSLLTPLFTHGYTPSMMAAVYSCRGGGEMLTVLFMRQHVSSKIKMPSVLLLTAFLTLLTVGPLTGAIAIYGPFEAADLRYPAFEQWRMVTFGKYISHLDFFSIFQWVAGAFIRISILQFMILDLIGLKKGRWSNIVSAILCILLVVLVKAPYSDMIFMNWLKNWYFPGTIALSVMLTLLILIAVLRNGSRKEKQAT